ncbi:MAG: molybdopterin-synthase adenylyltransferase MoeB [Candidatus Micrarchaeia archaeon]|jgi:adenylyltransferase/sulfurtransferase
MPDFSKNELQRYERQLIVPEIGLAGQKKISKAKVLVIGAGGLGGPALFYLAAAGVGTIGILDSDKVDLTNLNRQILHSEKAVGVFKTESARRTLSAFNPGVKLLVLRTRFGAENARKIVRQFDVVVDACDNFDTRYVANDACISENKPFVSGAVFRLEGRVSVFGGRGPCFRCVYPKERISLPKKRGKIGILGAVAGVMGCLEAIEAIKLILGKGKTLSGRMLVFNALNAHFTELRVHKRRNCPVCGIAARRGK